ncbi:AlpA family phage regulatory protein [Shinella sp.]|uniref:helix-turn-helix transcriptional regulator n=1 Tax=Shinella sp. TaxID=1870904 RepID=UPI0028AECFD1|nr:AlpA family phage regulatory protein [Shinella sp.]
MTQKDIHNTGANASTVAVPKFPTEGYVRLKAILAPNGPLPVSRSGFWAAVKAGKFPQPRKISARVTVWKAAEINELLAAIERGEAWSEISV